MSKAAMIREMYLRGEMTDSPEDKKRVAMMFGIAVQTVHATLVKMNGKPNHVPTHTPNIPKAPEIGTDIREIIRKRFDECYEIVKWKTDLPKIDIDFSLKGRVAGQFCRRRKFLQTRMYFRVNLVLAKNNLDEYLKQTVPHEFCHYFVHIHYTNAKSHGWEWKNAMRTLFGLDPKRCHNYDVSQSQGRATTKYEYKCNCKTFFIGAVRHRRLKLNPFHYRCAFCNSTLTFTGKIA